MLSDLLHSSQAACLLREALDSVVGPVEGLRERDILISATAAIMETKGKPGEKTKGKATDYIQFMTSRSPAF